MFLYPHATCPRTRLEGIFDYLYFIGTVALTGTFLFTIVDFVTRAANTFEGDWSQNRLQTAVPLRAVLANCTYTADMSLNFADVQVTLSPESVPLAFGIITSFFIGIFVIVGALILTDIIAKNMYSANVRHLRLRGTLLPVQGVLVAGIFGLSLAALLCIVVSYGTRDFLQNYIRHCASTFRERDAAAMWGAEIDTDVLFGTTLDVVLGAICANFFIVSLGVLCRVAFGWDRSERALLQAQYPFYDRTAVLCAPIEPLLVEYNRLLASKKAELDASPLADARFAPKLTGELLAADGKSFHLNDTKLRESSLEATEGGRRGPVTAIAAMDRRPFTDLVGPGAMGGGDAFDGPPSAGMGISAHQQRLWEMADNRAGFVAPAPSTFRGASPLDGPPRVGTPTLPSSAPDQGEPWSAADEAGDTINAADGLEPTAASRQEKGGAASTRSRDGPARRAGRDPWPQPHSADADGAPAEAPYYYYYDEDGNFLGEGASLEALGGAAAGDDGLTYELETFEAADEEGSGLDDDRPAQAQSRGPFSGRGHSPLTAPVAHGSSADDDAPIAPPPNTTRLGEAKAAAAGRGASPDPHEF